MSGNIDKICPEVEVRISQDGKVTSLSLQTLSRQKKREYTKNGNSQKYNALKKKMEYKLKMEGIKALEKQIENTNEKCGKWIKKANRISARPGEEASNTFTLPSHIDANQTPQESAEAIVIFFSKISQEHTPIEDDVSAKRMEAKARLEASPCEHPDIQEQIIYENMKMSKKTGSVPGDIPVSILHEFLPEFTTPVSAIIKQAVVSHEWPEIYKKEIHVPIKKIPAPQNEDDLRGIALD